MTIENDEAYLASLWDWACLDGCFGGTMIKPSDVDGRVERNGKVLEIETKLPGVSIPMGQEIMMTTLVQVYGFTEMIVWGHPGKPEKIELRTPHITKVYENTSLDTLRGIVKQWFRWADNQTPAPKFSDS
jgi:hypothetical protein